MAKDNGEKVRPYVYFGHTPSECSTCSEPVQAKINVARNGEISHANLVKGPCSEGHTANRKIPIKGPFERYFTRTGSLCTTCLLPVNATIRTVDDKKDGKVYLIKDPCERGHSKDMKILISTDAEHYHFLRNYRKQSEMPQRFNTKELQGCPWDCGLCDAHENHSCSTLIEITDECNMKCPTCFADSSPQRKSEERSLDTVIKMLDFAVKNEGHPDIIQISGGEPTIHSHFFEILDEVKARPIKYMMINTNGLRIAQDKEFAERLGEYSDHAEIYLQFDTFDDSVNQELRGGNYLDLKMQALHRLNVLGFSTNLVMTLMWNKRNLDEIGKMFDFARQQPSVRGVTYQLEQIAGRNSNFDPEKFDPSKDRLTLADIRRELIEQTGFVTKDDIMPVPCNPEALFMAYFFKHDDSSLSSITRHIDPTWLLEHTRSTMLFEFESLKRDTQEYLKKMFDPETQKALRKMLSTGASPDSINQGLYQLVCCIPNLKPIGENKIDYKDYYKHIFRVTAINFMDRFDFDVSKVRQSCVSIVDKNAERAIPFETMNLLYRDGLEKRYVKPQQVRILPEKAEIVE